MANTHIQLLQSHYPWVSSPLIVSAPMRVIAGSALAVAVSAAHGLGFIGAGTDISDFSDNFSAAISALESSPIPNSPPGVLPVGVGFICWGADLAAALSIIQEAKIKPAAAWLFAPRESKDLVSWSQGIKEASGGRTKMWIQVGAVKDCIEVAKLCKPDVFVIQGADAGGHGLAKSCSIISLLPECADALKDEGFGEIPLIGTGGIVDGRGVAAAVVLGASGVCIGTRFLATPEANISDGYRRAVVAAQDGGVSTARTKVYDNLRGTTGWPDTYNGRGVLNQSYWDHQKGVDGEENRRMYNESMKLGDAGWGDQGRMTTYAGTAVGLIKKVQPAGEIVQEVSRECKEILASARDRGRL